MIDLDLTFENSFIIAVSNHMAAESPVIVYPNPIIKDENLTIQLPSADFEYRATVSLIDQLGVVHQTTTTPIEDSTLVVNTATIAQGNYILIIETPYGKSHHKILVIK